MVMATPTTEQRVVLKKVGFADIYLKFKSDGRWYIRQHVRKNGDEKWAALDNQFVGYIENPPNDVVKIIL